MAGPMGQAGQGGGNLRRLESWPSVGTRRGHRAADKPRETCWRGSDFKGNLRQLTKKRQKIVSYQLGMRQPRYKGGKILTKGSNPRAGRGIGSDWALQGGRRGPESQAWSCHSHLLPTQQSPTNGFSSTWDRLQVQFEDVPPQEGLVATSYLLLSSSSVPKYHFTPLWRTLLGLAPPLE